MSVQGTALESLRRTEDRLVESTRRITRAAAASQVPGDAAQAADAVELSAEAVGLAVLRNSYEATLKAIQAASEMETRTLDILA